MKVGLRVSGVNEFRSDLRGVSAKIDRMPLAETAAESIVSAASRRMRSRGRMGAAVVRHRGIKVRGKKVILDAGSGRDVRAAVFALEYGAKRRRYQFSGRHVGRQRAAVLGDVPGYFIGWAATKKADQVAEAVKKELERGVNRALSN